MYRGWARFVPGFLAVCFAVAFALPASAERLPVRMFTMVDGLSHNVVNAVVRDSRGFVWFCTREGLSRFDGHSFLNFGTPQGLPSAVINALIEISDREYWVATAKGLVRFDPSGSPGVQGQGSQRRLFTTYQPGLTPEAQFVTSVHRGRSGELWVGTLAGLFRARMASPDADLALELVIDKIEVTAIVEDARGTIWTGTGNGVVSYRDGDVRSYRDGALHAHVQALALDEPGQMWVGTTTGLHRVSLTPGSDAVSGVVSFGRRDGLPTEWISQILRSDAGSLWVATSGGIAQLEGTSVPRFHAYDLSTTLTAVQTITIAQDGDYLWVGTSRGAARAATTGFTIFDASSGISSGGAIFTDPSGGVMVMGAGSDWELQHLVGDRFASVKMRRSKAQATWGWNQVTLIDKAGSWWSGTRQGILRFDGVSRVEQLNMRAPTLVFNRSQGLPADIVLRIFEDSRGDIWVSTTGEGHSANGLSRWQRSSNRWTSFTAADHLPPLDRYFVSSFAETARGVWLGFSGDAGLVRYRDGRFTTFDGDDGIPPGIVRNLLVDAHGDLWAASYRNGLIRLANPEGDQPQVRVWNRESGLSSNEVSALAQDLHGRIYLGTAGGLNRLDPMTDQVQRYDELESLGEFQGAVRDAIGAIWLSCAAGVLRVPPGDQRPQPPRPTYVTGLRLNTEPLRLSAIGEQHIDGLRLDAGTNSIEFEFVAPAGVVPDALYQIVLEGADQDWAPSSPRRSVTYANLAAGRYRFRVRTIAADGTAGRPAEVTFVVVPPVWRQAWFIGAVGLCISAGLLVTYRRNTRRRQALDSMRRRMARDLHDDIGANLTRIAVLSEVAQKQPAGSTSERSLASIARIARDSVSTMGDIVWAVNPKEDDLRDLARKMREYGDETCTAAGIRFSIELPAEDDHDRLDLDARRDLFLIFKEAVANAVRHSRCAVVQARMILERGTVTLEVTDDGHGLPDTGRSQGHGLRNMAERARRLGGRIVIGPSAPRGTVVRVEVPARRTHLFRQVARPTPRH